MTCPFSRSSRVSGDLGVGHRCPWLTGRDRGWPVLSARGVHGSILDRLVGVAWLASVDGVGWVGEQSPFVGSAGAVHHGGDGGQGVGLGGVVAGPDLGVSVAPPGFGRARSGRA
jgi:hypothetical protein